MKFMTLNSKMKKVRKGAYTSLLWERPAKTKKSCTDIIVKRTRATVRLGINYDNMASTKEKRKLGEAPQVSAGLPWGEWLKYPYFIKHKDKTYLRAYSGKNANITTEWYMNGRKVNKADVAQYLLKSELQESSEENKVFCLNIDDILSIG